MKREGAESGTALMEDLIEFCSGAVTTPTGVPCRLFATAFAAFSAPIVFVFTKEPTFLAAFVAALAAALAATFAALAVFNKKELIGATTGAAAFARFLGVAAFIPVSKVYADTKFDANALLKSYQSQNRSIQNLIQMNIRLILAGLVFLAGILLMGFGAGLNIFPALVVGILLVSISGAAYMLSLFQTRSALSQNSRPVIVV